MLACARVVYSEAQTDRLVELVPSIEALASLRESGFSLMPQPPIAMTFLEVRSLEATLFRVRNARASEWYECWGFASSELTDVGWVAIRHVAPGDLTLNKPWSEQNKLLGLNEAVSSLAELTWFVTTLFKVRRTKLFTATCVRTASLFSDECHIHFGHLDGERLDIGFTRDAYHHDILGLAILRKF